MKPETDRTKVEKAILGACLLESGAYMTIADILKPGNFSSVPSGFDHQKIFKCLVEFYPLTPIDLITVAHKLRGYAPYLAELMCEVNSSSNLRYHALLLLQLDIQDKFIQLLTRLKSTETVSLSTQLALNEIIDECLDTENDILEIIDRAPEYLKNLHVEFFISSDIEAFQKGVHTRAGRIKQQASVECLFNNLTRLGAPISDPGTQRAVNQLKDLIKVAIMKGKLDVGLIDQILRLNITG